MNWEMLGALAESAGALGVIISVLYLAVQVRSGTKATQQKNAHDQNNSAREIWIKIAEDEEFASIWRRGLIDPNSLNESELLRFSVMMTTATTVAEESYFAAQDKGIASWAGEAQRRGFKEIAPMPGYLYWYKQRGHWVSLEFQKVLETYMKESTSPIADWYRPEENKSDDE